MDISSRLQRGANELGLSLSETKIDRLLLYLALIQKWNKAYNLVGTSNTADLVEKHLLDSLSIYKFIKESPVLDVGSGAGLPGIPLAITLPDISFTLVDANGKKVRFMRQACIELNLTNVEIVQSRIETYATDNEFKTVIARAFAPLESALCQLAEACIKDGQINIMLGVPPQKLPENKNICNLQVHELNVPGLDSKRHLLVANKAQ